MPKIIHPGLFRWLLALVLVALLFLPTSGATAQTDTLKTKIKVVEVTTDGTTIRVDPARVKLKRKTDVVVWVTNGQSLKIDFKTGNPSPGNPFTDLVCKGQFCGALTPPDVAPNVFRYKVTVDGVVLDPDVEVVP